MKIELTIQERATLVTCLKNERESIEKKFRFHDLSESVRSVLEIRKNAIDSILRKI